VVVLVKHIYIVLRETKAPGVWGFIRRVYNTRLQEWNSLASHSISSLDPLFRCWMRKLRSERRSVWI